MKYHEELHKAGYSVLTAHKEGKIDEAIAAQMKMYPILSNLTNALDRLKNVFKTGEDQFDRLNKVKL